MGRRKIEILPIQESQRHVLKGVLILLIWVCSSHPLGRAFPIVVKFGRVMADMGYDSARTDCSKRRMNWVCYATIIKCTNTAVPTAMPWSNRWLMVEQYTGERDVKTPADFGGDKANNDDDEDGSDDAVLGAGTSRGKFAMSSKKRGREDDHGIDYEVRSSFHMCSDSCLRLAQSSGHLLHLQQHPPRPIVPPSSSMPNIRPPYLSQQQPVDALMEREREREREREGALRQLGLQHLLASNQVPPPTSHPSLNLAALLQANPLLGLGMPGLNLGLAGLPPAGPQNNQQDLLAMLSANAANINQSSSGLYSNPLFSTLFPNHPNLNDSAGHQEQVHKPMSGGPGVGGGDIWPSLSRSVNDSSNAGPGGDTSWLSFLGTGRTSQPPGAADDVDLSGLFPFEVSAGGDDDDERGGKSCRVHLTSVLFSGNIGAVLTVGRCDSIYGRPRDRPPFAPPDDLTRITSWAPKCQYHARSAILCATRAFASTPAPFLELFLAFKPRYRMDTATFTTSPEPRSRSRTHLTLTSATFNTGATDPPFALNLAIVPTFRLFRDQHLLLEVLSIYGNSHSVNLLVHARNLFFKGHDEIFQRFAAAVVGIGQMRDDRCCFDRKRTGVLPGDCPFSNPSFSVEISPNASSARRIGTAETNIPNESKNGTMCMVKNIKRERAGATNGRRSRKRWLWIQVLPNTCTTRNLWQALGLSPLGVLMGRFLSVPVDFRLLESSELWVYATFEILDDSLCRRDGLADAIVGCRNVNGRTYLAKCSRFNLFARTPPPTKYAQAQAQFDPIPVGHVWSMIPTCLAQNSQGIPGVVL
ncbi:hypothetical protein AG1IA_02926 [Rhizoctonia solani AG-1 IA]|uniref:Uncharacterized protein n=1 Tax=Thanatephorus cucumeris (strain AG1-IA) TaxID=983506 RepID=L8X1Z6_THACA|nr:hypothetical protein AG1IA_02926 [Rhizoctonia solani AG-1 IA]